MAEYFEFFEEIVDKIDLNVIINRIYLDYYVDPKDFWNDLKIMLNNYDIINSKRTDNDQYCILCRMRELITHLFV